MSRPHWRRYHYVRIYGKLSIHIGNTGSCDALSNLAYMSIFKSADIYKLRYVLKFHRYYGHRPSRSKVIMRPDPHGQNHARLPSRSKSCTLTLTVKIAHPGPHGQNHAPWPLRSNFQNADVAVILPGEIHVRCQRPIRQKIMRNRHDPNLIIGKPDPIGQN